jgi:hypothetical protein
MSTKALNEQQLRGAVVFMSVDKLKAMPTIDAPGKKVGDILDAKRTDRGHAHHVEQVKERGVDQPVHVKDGVFQDGHHRLAAAEDARQWMVPVLEERGRR